MKHTRGGTGRDEVAPIVGRDVAPRAGGDAPGMPIERVREA